MQVWCICAVKVFENLTNNNFGIPSKEGFNNNNPIAATEFGEAFNNQ